MFTETWFDNGINFVINGCFDCPLRIIGTPRDWCRLSYLYFGIDGDTAVGNFKTSRPPSCKLPFTHGQIRFSPHSYSNYSEKDLEQGFDYKAMEARNTKD